MYVCDVFVGVLQERAQRQISLMTQNVLSMQYVRGLRVRVRMTEFLLHYDTLWTSYTIAERSDYVQYVWTTNRLGPTYNLRTPCINTLPEYYFYSNLLDSHYYYDIFDTFFVCIYYIIMYLMGRSYSIPHPENPCTPAYY